MSDFEKIEAVESSATNAADNWKGMLEEGGDTVGEHHKNVNSRWLEQCISLEDLLGELEKVAAQNIDIVVPLHRTKMIGNGQGVLSLDLGEGYTCPATGNEVGGEYEITPHTFNQISAAIDQPTSFLKHCQDDEYGNESEIIENFYQMKWSKFCKHHSHNHLKGHLLRFRDDNGRKTVNQFRPADCFQFSHLDYVRTLEAVQKQGDWDGGDFIVSKFDREKFVSSYGDYFRADFLVPNAAREDDGFGGILFGGGSEVGGMSYFQNPGLFRYICCNGLIWDKQQNKSSLWKLHGAKRKTSLDVERKNIVKCAVQSLGLFVDISEIFKSLESLAIVADDCDGGKESTRKLTYQLLGRLGTSVLGYSQRDTIDLMRAFDREPQYNAFGVVNAITRHCQAFTNLEKQTESEIVAGIQTSVWGENPDKFAKFVDSANGFQLTGRKGLLSEGALHSMISA